MKVDGRKIAQHLLDNLKKDVHDLKTKGIKPHLAVILVGYDQASHAYVRQKKLKGEQIGMIVSIHEFDVNISEDKILSTIQQFNNDTNIHGIVIQQPLPEHIDAKKLVEATDPSKDVDGFHSGSTFTPPIAEAAIEILKEIYFSSESGNNNLAIKQFNNWLHSKNIVVIGKGETGGTPIRNKLEKLGAAVTVVDSKTENPNEITKHADIIISCVGRANIIKGENIKEGAILLSVGMFRGEDEKLHGDYEEDDIKDIAEYYTPVPGGIGPVNVAELLGNVINAATNNL